MKIFTVGPVEMDDEIRRIGGEPIPYFRTPEFSKLMLRVEDNFKKVVHAPQDARLIVLTASGTGAMEAAVSNVLDKEDKVLVINGGSFGRRFAQLCEHFEIPYTEIKLAFGEVLTGKHLEPFENQGYTALMVNLHETSVGQLYDIDLLSAFCKRNHLLFIADVISTLFADAFDMEASGVDVVIASSQKAMALPPGLSFIMTDRRAEERIMNHHVASMYFDLKDYYKNMERGQTPFTPAVGTILQLDYQLQKIADEGIDAVVEQHAKRAAYFRNLCAENGIQIADYPKSNALTPLIFEGNAYDIFLRLKDEYQLMLTPNGGELSGRVLRVGHLGNLKNEDYDAVVRALKEVIG